MEDRMLRALADGENIRKLGQKETETAKKYAIQSFAKALTEVSDNLSRALQKSRSSHPSEDVVELESPEQQQQRIQNLFHHLNSLYEGVALTKKELTKVFSNHGVSEFEPVVGEKFNPTLHMALFQVPHHDPSKAGTVFTVVKTGYTLHDRVIRAAEVGVAVEKPPPPPPPTEESPTHDGSPP